MAGSLRLVADMVEWLEIAVIQFENVKKFAILHPDMMGR
jgi:hypothetical protein